MTLQDKAPARDPREYFDCETDYFAEELQAQAHEQEHESTQ